MQIINESVMPVAPMVNLNFNEDAAFAKVELHHRDVLLSEQEKRDILAAEELKRRVNKREQKAAEKAAKKE